jgi:hypothetical protein
MENFDLTKFLAEGKLYEADNKSVLRTLIQDLEPFEYEVYAFDAEVDPEDGAQMEEYIASLSDMEVSSEISKLKGINEDKLDEGKLLKENITKLDNYALEIYSDFRKDPSIHFPDVEFEVDEEGFALENDSNYSQLKKYKREIMGLHALFGEESGVKDKNGLQLSMDGVIDNI